MRIVLVLNTERESVTDLQTKGKDATTHGKSESRVERASVRMEMMTVVTRQHSHTSRNYRTQAIPHGTIPREANFRTRVTVRAHFARVAFVNRNLFRFPSFAGSSLSCVFLPFFLHSTTLVSYW